MIKNISPCGAKLAVNQNATIPTDFDLEIPMKRKAYRARLRWRDAEGVGVEFIDEVDTRDPGNVRFEQLQAENARLKSAIRTLTKKLEDLGQDVSKFT